MTKFLQHLHPVDAQYMYRFACGLDPNVAERVINYLQNVEGGDLFAILCLFEQPKKADGGKQTIRQICLQGIIISDQDSLLLQRSTMQLLEIATRNDVSKCLCSTSA